MKRIILTIMGLCLAVAPAVRAEQWSKTYTVTGKPELRVGNLRCQHPRGYLGPEHHRRHGNN